jgi:Ser/Thr protein kinase RdoA (MazF antagonist)
VGEFLASFHLAASRSATSDLGPRPGGAPMADLQGLVDWTRAPVALGSPAAVLEIRDRLGRHHSDLAALDFDGLPRTVVHGDPTTFNILATGDPRRPSGLIDFELADLEPAVVDIAACLWRSGRPSQPATHLHLPRVAALVRGYHAVRPLAENELALVPVCLRGRGLQMLVKRTRSGVPTAGPVDELT